MAVTDWIKSLFAKPRPQSGVRDARPGAPTAQELQTARDRLDKMARPATFGEIGGGRPDTENRAASWWGGNFLAAPGETIPLCDKSGRAMHPVLQIRMDELPETPPAFQGLALVTLWMDLQSDAFWGAGNGTGFLLRTYPDIKPLVPLGPGYRQSADLPTFPVFWRDTVLEQPSWEDTAGAVPHTVACATDSDWFFNSEYLTDHYSALRSKYPVKIGGWPTWIQGASWPKDAQFVFQVDANDKGQLFLGDSGSIYLFKTGSSWAIRGDCF